MRLMGADAVFSGAEIVKALLICNFNWYETKNNRISLLTKSLSALLGWGLFESFGSLLMYVRKFLRIWGSFLGRFLENKFLEIGWKVFCCLHDHSAVSSSIKIEIQINRGDCLNCRLRFHWARMVPLRSNLNYVDSSSHRSSLKKV